MEKDKQIFSLLSLAMKAGKCVSGEFEVLEGVKEEKVCLVIVALDASENTKKLFVDKSSYRNIPYIFFGTKEENARAIGKKERAVLGITDKGFTKALLEKL